MLLSPRTVMMSLIAVPAALLANILLTPVGVAQDAVASARSQAISETQIQTNVQPLRTLMAQRLQRFAPRSSGFPRSGAVPRQVLVIDLNPVLDFGVQEEWDRFSQPLDDPALLEVAPVEAYSFNAVPAAPTSTAYEPAMRAVVLPSRSVRPVPVADRSPSRLPQVEAAGASPFAAALAPRPAELSPSGASASRGHVTAQPQLQTWDAPFPSLGQPQLDRQLRRYLAYLKTVGQPDILIVGGQGAAQGVDPLALQDSLGDRGYKDIKVFNWGLSDSSAQTVEWLLTELLTTQQLPKLVVWAESSVALNGGRQDSAWAKIQSSPGHRFLARGLRPKLSDQEKSLAQKLGQILRNPIPRALPDSVMALARSPLDWSSSLKSNTKADAKTPFKPDQATVEQAVDVVGVVEIAQAAPVFVDSRDRVLPILRPQKPLPATASTHANGLGNGTGDVATVQAETPGFRLVNWCRHANGPCQTQEGQSPSALVEPAVPPWLRQTQAAQEAAQEARRQRAGQLNQPRASRSAALQARRSQTSSSVAVPALGLPDWPQSQASKQFLQAMGFQSIEQRLESSQTGQPLLRGDQDSDYRNFSLQGEQNRALHRLVLFGQQQDMAIAFVQLPLSQRYLDIERQSREQSFRTYLDVAAQMTPLNLVELPGDGLFWNDSLFAKPNRLNRYGAAVLSWQIGQAMDGGLLRGLR